MLKRNYKESLDMLLVDRKNEFRELASVILIPQTKEGWEKYVLQFCMHVDDAFKIWTGSEVPKDHNVDHQTMILLRMIARDQSTMTNVAHLLHIAHTLAQEFKEIYKRLG
mgnify:CR=1 FL=1|jgi:hypothetical protein|tara:strand:- start:439 stop:768 length:330 start_codon:yes stop_codon:yes gene_type:complete